MTPPNRRLAAWARAARSNAASFRPVRNLWVISYLATAILTTLVTSTFAVGIGYVLGAEGAYRAQMEAQMARQERDGMYRAYLKTAEELETLKARMDELDRDAYWTGWEHACELFGLKVGSDCYSLMESLRRQETGQ